MRKLDPNEDQYLMELILKAAKSLSPEEKMLFEFIFGINLELERRIQ